MVQRQTYLTPEGLAKLREELEHLQTARRRDVAEQLKKASEVGGTVDNAEYDEAKREQARVEGRIRDLEMLLRSAVIIPSHTTPSETIQVGSKVKVQNQKGKVAEYVIVGSTEANPLEGRISNESPVGRAILGKRTGDEVEAHTPAGVVKLKIVAVR
ncbi:MAG: transcription elongation factor GreA [Chloroflexi bacterium]|nr:transcription elongation factor GreA [Chloroflexota bacterium]